LAAMPSLVAQASLLCGLSMLCSLRLSALPKKLYEAQVKGRPEDGDVLLATWVDLRGDPAAVSHYIVGLLLYHWDQDLLLVEHVQCTDSSKS